MTRLERGRVPIETDAGENVVVVDAVMRYRHDGEGLHRAVDPADGRHYVYAMTFLDAAPSVFGVLRPARPQGRLDTCDVRAPARLGRARQLAGDRRSTPGRWDAGADPAAVDVPGRPGRRPVPRGPQRARRHPARPQRARVASRATSTTTPRRSSRSPRSASTSSTGCSACATRSATTTRPSSRSSTPARWRAPAASRSATRCVFQSRALRTQHVVRASTIVHEMAHMWFGDLVTPVWWDDLWLNESFAEYIGARVTADATEFTEVWVTEAHTRRPWGLAADQRPSTHPVAGNGAADGATALQNFDGISYAKGATIIKQLHAAARRRGVLPRRQRPLREAPVRQRHDGRPPRLAGSGQGPVTCRRSATAGC